MPSAETDIRNKCKQTKYFTGQTTRICSRKRPDGIFAVYNPSTWEVQVCGDVSREKRVNKTRKNLLNQIHSINFQKLRENL
jgi:hypothetical protein